MVSEREMSERMNEEGRRNGMNEEMDERGNWQGK
jgi:hypothetical protein